MPRAFGWSGEGENNDLSPVHPAFPLLPRKAARSSPVVCIAERGRRPIVTSAAARPTTSRARDRATGPPRSPGGRAATTERGEQRSVGSLRA